MRAPETFEAKLERVLKDEVRLAAYDPAWPGLFAAERAHLLECLPAGLLGRIAHFGSTAVPGLIAKPVIDMLVEVADLQVARELIAPCLEAQAYDYFWRPAHGDDTPPFYAWFIKRDAGGARSHHIHVVEPQFEHWQRLYFRDYLIEKPAVARQYAELKLRLAREYPHDRLAYTAGKTAFIEAVTSQARLYYRADKA